jgi:hypothetical protein
MVCRCRRTPTPPAYGHLPTAWGGKVRAQTSVTSITSKTPETSPTFSGKQNTEAVHPADSARLGPMPWQKRPARLLPRRRPRRVFLRGPDVEKGQGETMLAVCPAC